MESKRLTARQAKFVAEYCATGNGSEAARRAGYSSRTAREMASENLTKPAIKAAITAHKAEYRSAVELTKGDVVGGLLAAVAMAREKGDAGAQVRGWVELARLMGLYDQPADIPVVSACGAALLAKLVGMSDDDLLTMIASPGRQK